MSKKRPITIFTPPHAAANAQQLTVKEIVARLPPERFHVTMFSGANPDPRIQARPNYPRVLQSILDPEPARQLFARHPAGEDGSDQLFRWIVLIRRCTQL